MNLIALLALLVVPSDSANVNLAEDEFILPPYLMRVEGGKLNLNAGQKKYSTEPGEWLDLDQNYNLNQNLALQVLLHEHAQWVGGGVLKMSAAKKEWNKAASPYLIQFERGVLGVWVNTNKEDRRIQIKTNQETFTAQSAVFWISAHAGVTEFYLHEGTITDDDGKIWSGKKYIRYENGSNGVSTGWNAEAYKIKIAGLYPNLVKLLEAADDDWKSEKVKEVYHQARENGWRNKLRKQK